MTNDYKFKKCPFCGGIPETKVYVTQCGGDEDHIRFTIYCPVCGIYKSKTSYRIDNKGINGINSIRTFKDVVETMNELTELWNRRETDA